MDRDKGVRSIGPYFLIEKAEPGDDYFRNISIFPEIFGIETVESVDSAEIELVVVSMQGRMEIELVTLQPVGLRI